MTTVATPTPAIEASAEEYPHARSVGPIGRLGRYTATHFRTMLAAWIVSHAATR